MGRLAEEKNIEELIDYYDKLNIEKLKFILVGGGPYLDSLKEYSEKIDKRIYFAGMVKPKEVNNYYRMADAFVSASKSETQGLTYYEAMSNGTLAICRKDLCLDHVIIDDFNGYQYKDFYDFEKFLKIIFSDDKKREELSQNARDYALENFSIDSFGKKCEELYKKALEKEIIDENSYI